MKASIRSAVAIFAAIAALLVPAVALAATTPNLTQNVSAGTLTMDILQNDGTTSVASPTSAFSAASVSFSCQTTTSVLPSSTNRLYVSNLAGGNFNVTMAATGGPTALWTDGSKTYDYNDPAGTTAGCDEGQLTVNPSAGTITTDCSSVCNGVTVSAGSSTAYSDSVDDITIMSTASTAAWKGYITGVTLSQKIPPSQPAGSNYSLPMTLTAGSF
jgi:hypothetical protein